MRHSRLPLILVMGLVTVLAAVAVHAALGYSWSETRALYLLSGLGQAFAAVFALAFTMILVGVQLGSRHSPRLWTSILNTEAVCLSAFLGLSAVLPFWFLTQPSTSRIAVALVLGSATLVWLISYAFRLPARIAPENRIRALGDEAVRSLKQTPGHEPQAIKVLDDFIASGVSSHDIDIFQQALQQLLRATIIASSTRQLPDPTVAEKVLSRIETDLYLSAAVTGTLLHTTTPLAESFRDIATNRRQWLALKWTALLTSLHANLAVRSEPVASGDATMLLGILGQELASAGWNRQARNVVFVLEAHKALARTGRDALLITPTTSALAGIADSALASNAAEDTEISSQELACDIALALRDLAELIAEMEVQRTHLAGSNDLTNYQITGDILIEIGATLLQQGADRLAFRVADSIVAMERATTVQLRGPALIGNEGFTTTAHIRKTIVTKASLRDFWQAVLYLRHECRGHNT